MIRYAVSSSATQASEELIGAPFTAQGHLSPSFVMKYGAAFNVSVWGTFVASVQLERCIDGVNWLPITAAGTQLYAWTAPASESAEEGQPGVTYRLHCTAYTSGSVNYLISQ